MELSIQLASYFDPSNFAELFDQTCRHVQQEIQSPSLPQLPIFKLTLENGTQFRGIPLRIVGKENFRYITMLTSDPIERPINTTVVPFARIQTVEIEQCESIMGILTKREATSGIAKHHGTSLGQIRNQFESRWRDLAGKHNLLPYIYLNWDAIGNTDFEKQNILSITAALLKAIEKIVVKSEMKKMLFNKLQTVELANSPVKDPLIEKQGAFLYIKANFQRAPSIGIETELFQMLFDVLI